MKMTMRIIILGLALILPASLGFSLDPAMRPHLLDLTPMPTQRYDRLTPNAKKHYDQGMVAVDRINYQAALESLIKAGEAEPNNDYLQLMVAQLARYLGDTQWGKDSIDYYDKAAKSLKKLADSPRLNPREKERAKGHLETVLSLRQAVGERDEKRQQYGMVIAKAYAKEAYKDKDEKYTEKEKKEKKERIKQLYQKSLGLVGVSKIRKKTTRSNRTSRSRRY